MDRFDLYGALYARLHGKPGADYPSNSTILGTQGKVSDSVEREFHRQEFENRAAYTAYDDAEDEAVARGRTMSTDEIVEEIEGLKEDYSLARSRYNSAYRSWNTQRGDPKGHDPKKEDRLNRAEIKVTEILGEWSGLGRHLDYRRGKGGEDRTSTASKGAPVEEDPIEAFANLIFPEVTKAKPPFPPKKKPDGEEVPPDESAPPAPADPQAAVPAVSPAGPEVPALPLKLRSVIRGAPC